MRIVLLLFLIPALAGCISEETTDDPATANSEELLARMPAQGIDWSLLSKDEFEVTAPQQFYVPSHDGILLHVVVHLPDGEGPWPTILQNSPYYDHPANGVETISLVAKYVPKGYAVVSADVRGTGNSEGCMDMMGPTERRDTYELVEWVAAQDWSDGHVGMQGVSYVGTTPHEALLEAPPHLDTVVTVAGVVNQWRNVYQGGVPYQGRFYPITYESTEGAPPPTDFTRQPNWLFNAADGACDQEEALAAMSPGTYEKGVYSSYWDDRNFTKEVGNAKASILYSQGFVDRAVNPIEAVGWFNDLPVPKKAFLHQGGHQYPPREDYMETELAWFDYWLKGIQNGVMDTPIVEVQMNDERIRIDTEWPPANTEGQSWHLSPQGLVMNVPADEVATYFSGPGIAAPSFVQTSAGPTALFYDSPALTSDVVMAGSANLRLVGGLTEMDPGDNAFWLFDLYDVPPTGEPVWISEGRFNAHLRDGLDHISPLESGEKYNFNVVFEPRDYLFAEGHSIRLVAEGYDAGVSPWDEYLVELEIAYGVAGSELELPIVVNPRMHDAPPEVTDEEGIPTNEA